jgi:hypothetical protein
MSDSADPAGHAVRAASANQATKLTNTVLGDVSRDTGRDREARRCLERPQPLKQADRPGGTSWLRARAGPSSSASNSCLANTRAPTPGPHPANYAASALGPGCQCHAE